MAGIVLERICNLSFSNDSTISVSKFYIVSNIVRFNSMSDD